MMGAASPPPRAGGWSRTAAVWGQGKEATKSASCFLHVQAGGVIYQRNAAKGDWYVFKHAKPEPSDEYHKLVAGNRVPATASE